MRQTSWNLLDETAQKVLATLSVFRDDFTRQAAQTVSGASLNILQTLVSQTLLNWSPMGYFHLHELLRQFAAEKLAQHPLERQRAYARHANFYLEVLAIWVESLKGPDQRRTLDALRASHNNTLAAWDWATGQGAATQLLPLVDGICYYFHLRVHYAEGAALCPNMLAALEKSASTPVAAARLQIRLLAWQGRFGWLLGNRETAQQALNQAQTHLDALALVDK